MACFAACDEAVQPVDRPDRLPGDILLIGHQERRGIRGGYWVRCDEFEAMLARYGLAAEDVVAEVLRRLGAQP